MTYRLSTDVGGRRSRARSASQLANKPENPVGGRLGGEGVVGEPQGEGAGVNGVEAGEEGLDRGSAAASSGLAPPRSMCTSTDASQTICRTISDSFHGNDMKYSHIFTSCDNYVKSLIASTWPLCCTQTPNVRN